MHLKQLDLLNFRNYEQISLAFDNKVNVFIGENAQGKTNILEAIYFLSMAKSHRTSLDRELIKWQEDFVKIEGKVEKRSSVVPLEIQISKQGKKAKVNHLEQNRLSQYVGHLNVVMFAPEDLNLVKGGPQVRRRFLDMEIGQISPVYLYDVSQYINVLKQRNALLKQLNMQRSTDTSVLDILTEQLISYGAKVIEKRFHFLELLRKRAQKIHFGITHELEHLKILYQSSLGVSESMDLSKILVHYQEKFDKIVHKEIDRGTTLIGPHRDDLSFLINDKDVHSFCSQGQQRTTALSLKLAEIELIYDELGEYPVLLLDDVLSELDSMRQSHLLEIMQDKVQTFITTTSASGIESSTLSQSDRFFVKNGTILKD